MLTTCTRQKIYIGYKTNFFLPYFFFFFKEKRVIYLSADQTRNVPRTAIY